MSYFNDIKEENFEKIIVSYDDMIKEIEFFLPDICKIGRKDNLISLGLDSMKVMRILNKWRKKGHKVKFSELMESPVPEKWFELLVRESLLLNCEKLSTSEKVERKNEDMPFALTDVQYAYWIGRDINQPLGGVGCHVYIEIDGENIDPLNLGRAWKEVTQFHPMLRTKFFQNGTQKIFDKTFTPELKINDFRQFQAENITDGLELIRKRLSHRILKIESGVTAGLELTMLPEADSRLHFDLDLLVADVNSFQIILRDLCLFYKGTKSNRKGHPFRFDQYLKEESERLKEEEKRSEEYWKTKIFDLPGPPDIPLAMRPDKIRNHEFERFSFIIGNESWDMIKQKAAINQKTPAMVLLTIYAEILDIWSSKSKFLINIPLFNRKTEYDFIEDAVADFTNILLFDIDMTEKQSFSDRLNHIQKKFYEISKYSSWSGVKVQREIAKITGNNSVAAPVVFSCNLGTPLTDSEFEETLGKISYMISQTPQVWLDLQVYETQKGLLLCFDSVKKLFPENMIRAMADAFKEMLKWLSSSDYNWDLAWEYNFADIISGKNLPWKSQCIHNGFYEYAELNPENTALIRGVDGLEIKYGQLKKQALSISAYLRENGVKKGDSVAVVMNERCFQIASVLGILAMGAYYVAVAPDQPLQRRKKIHEKASIQVAITEMAVQEIIQWPENCKILDVHKGMETEPINFPLEISSDETAYVIFTSGSTGEPKGVEISHSSAFNTIKDVNLRCTVTENDIIMGISSLEFDLSVYDIFGILGCGGKIVTIPWDSNRDSSIWLKFLEKYKVTIWNTVPILLEMLFVIMESRISSLNSMRMVILSGDWIQPDLPARAKKFFPDATIAAMGGATEASIWSNIYDASEFFPVEWQSVPYGKPLTNQNYRIVDSKGRDCPEWVAGELLIGGKGLAKGYTGDPEVTDASFIKLKDKRWYKTGDIGRLRPCGNIEFLGRKDFQLKIRGHRIESGEVENAINKFKGVENSIVMKNEDSTGIEAAVLFPGIESSDANLLEGNLEALLEDNLRKFLSRILPDYMIPGKIIFLKEFPLNKNGKFHRKEISSILKKNSTQRNRCINRLLDELESIILDVWKEVLKARTLENSDNFFICGGDSLKATKIIEKLILKKIAPEDLSLGLFFKSPTISGLAEQIRFLKKEDEASDNKELEFGII